MHNVHIAFIALVTACLATPTTRQVSPACAIFGAGAFDNAANFTITALNRTQLNANNTGVPLVLGESCKKFRVLSTLESSPSKDIDLFSMVNGGLIVSSGSQVEAVSRKVGNGQEVTFLASTKHREPAKVYCAIADTDPAGGGSGDPVISLNSHTDLFSLCMSNTSLNAQNSIVFNATADTSNSYIFETCYPVGLQLVFPNTI